MIDVLDTRQAVAVTSSLLRPHQLPDDIKLACAATQAAQISRNGTFFSIASQECQKGHAQENVVIIGQQFLGLCAGPTPLACPLVMTSRITPWPGCSSLMSPVSGNAAFRAI
jgi:hypothetical protein